MKHFKDIFHSVFTQPVIFIIFVLVMVTPNIFLSVTEPLSPAFTVAYLLLPLSVYMILLLTCKKPGIPFWILFPVHFIGAFQLVLLYLFGNSIIASDMFINVFTTNSNEASELLDNLIPAIIGVILLYVPALLLGVYSIREKDKLGKRFRQRAFIISLIVMSIGTIFYGRAHKQSPAENTICHIYPVNAVNNMRFAVRSWEKSKKYPVTSQNFTFHAASCHPADMPEIYVLVIGETSRAENWGLYGYSRNTTPLLEKTPGVLHFDDVITQVNATHKSVPLMMCAASAENFDLIYSQKSLITAFNEAGYQTAFLSNQLYNGSFTDFFADEAHLNRNLKGERPNENTRDKELLPVVDSLLAGPHSKQLIVLHTYGSHLNYCERYGNSSRIYMPDHVTGIKMKNKTQMVNSYDNSIRATDKFLTRLIMRLQKTGKPAALIYLSDHGEDLLDDKHQKFLHASPIPSYYQLHIPFIMWTSKQYKETFPEKVKAACSRHHTPFNSRVVFHTLLDMAGIDTPYKNDSLSLVNSKFVTRERLYLGEHNLPVKLSKLGLNKEDIEQFQKHKLALY